MQRRHWRWLLTATLLAGLMAVAVPRIRTQFLRTIGWLLVVQEPVQRADVIVISVDAYSEGVLEAADLVRSGVAKTVAVFTDPPNAVDREFLRRGIPYNNVAERAVAQLEALGVPTIELIRRHVATGTEDMSELLPDWCERHGIRSIIMVTTPDHSRRVSRVLRRSMKGRDTKVFVQRVHHADFDPDRWWLSRDGLRRGIVELQKLLLDVTRHPIS